MEVLEHTLEFCSMGLVAIEVHHTAVSGYVGQDSLH